MANTLITPPEIDSDVDERDNPRPHTGNPLAGNTDRSLRGRAEASAFANANAGPNLGEPEQLKSINPFQSLISNFRDTFFPEKLPPLVLESKPIAVADPMQVKRDPVSTGIAVGFHALALLLVIWISAKAIKTVIAPTPKKVENVTFNEPPPPPPILRTPVKQSSGGGGGQHDIAPVSKGAPPKFAVVQIVPPSAPPKIPPKLAVAPTVQVDPKLQMKSDLPNIGMVNSPNVGVSMGNGHGTGVGSGNGSGYGPGSGQGTGGGAYRPGENGVSEPRLIYQVDPEFSEEARKAKFQGEVMVHLIVDSSGRPVQVKVTRPVGMGLDEKAREAVSQYRFKPAQKDGHPVPVEMFVAVNFQIF